MRSKSAVTPRHREDEIEDAIEVMEPHNAYVVAVA
jgi:hypothetical protein